MKPTTRGPYGEPFYADPDRLYGPIPEGEYIVDRAGYIVEGPYTGRHVALPARMKVRVELRYEQSEPMQYKVEPVASTDNWQAGNRAEVRARENRPWTEDEKAVIQKCPRPFGPEDTWR